MTNYNERLDKAIINELFGGKIPLDEPEQRELAFRIPQFKVAITSLIKELVTESKPYRETIIDKWNKDRETYEDFDAWRKGYEIDEIMELITADRKRVALEARIREVEYSVVQLESSEEYAVRRIAELKAQQKEV